MISATGETHQRRLANLLTSLPGRSLVFSIFLLSFIPYPKLPALGIAPINVLFFIAIIYLFTKIKVLLKSDRGVRAILILYLIYVIWFTICVLVKGEDRNFFSLVRMLILMVFLVAFCNTCDNLHFAIKCFLFGAILTTILGTAVYLWGGPFIELRSFLTRDISDKAIGVGSQLTGMYTVPHVFGYLLAGVLVICMALHVIGRPFAFLCAVLFLVAVFLNAERSVLAANLIVMIILFKTEAKYRHKLLRLGVVFCIAILLMVSYLSLKPKNAIHASGNRYDLIEGTLDERLRSTSFAPVIDRLRYALKGIGVWIKYPMIGTDYSTYSREINKWDKTEAAFHSSRLESTLATHNHYINIGIWTGIPGIIISVIFLIKTFQIYRSGKKVNDDDIRLLHRAFFLGLLAALIVAFFHNNGIFGGEFASASFTSFFLATSNLIGRNATVALKNRC